MIEGSPITLAEKVKTLQNGDGFDQTVAEIIVKTGQPATHNSKGTELFHHQDPAPKVIPRGPFMFGEIALPPEFFKKA